MKRQKQLGTGPFLWLIGLAIGAGAVLHALRTSDPVSEPSGRVVPIEKEAGPEHSSRASVAEKNHPPIIAPSQPPLVAELTALAKRYRSLSKKQRRRLSRLCEILGEYDFNKTVALIERLGLPERLKAQALLGYSKAEPYSGLTWASRNFLKAGGSTENLYLNRWAAGAFYNAPSLVYSFIRTVGDETTKADVLGGISVFANRTNDFQKVYSYLSSADSDEQVTRVLGQVANSWRIRDFSGLADFVNSPEGREIAAHIAGPYIDGLARVDPALALSQINSLKIEHSKDLTIHVLTTWAFNSEDPLGWMAANSGIVGNTVRPDLIMYAAAVASRDTDVRLDVLRKMKDAEVKSRLARRILAQADADELAQLHIYLDQDFGTRAMAGLVLEKLAEVDPRRAVRLENDN